MIVLALQSLIVPAFSPLCIGIIRKIKARMQGRVGASILQPYRDLWKLFHKDEVLSTDSSWISRYAPYLIFSITILVGASIPVLTTVTESFSLFGVDVWVPFLPVADFVVIIYLFAFATFALAVMGMDAGGGFGGFGSSREMTVAALAEGGLFFTLLAPALIAGVGDLFMIPTVLLSVPFAVTAPLILAFFGFFIVFLAENKRFPVDNPATHLELTMIHEAMLLEHSGKRLALLEWASANKLLIFAILGANMFIPFGIASTLTTQTLLMSALWLALKVLVMLGTVAFIESTIAKMRMFRIPDLLFTACVLGIIAVGIIIAG